MDKWGLRKNNGWNGKLLNPFEESKQVLAHIANLTFISVEWQDKVKEGGPMGVLMDEEDKVIVACILGMQDCGFPITL
jgi:hypothetical protein